MTDAWDIVLHLDRHVAAISADYGLWSYVLLFGVVFAETGLIVTTILPSDTVLFAAGAMAAKGMFPLWALYPGFCLAAFAGATVAYLAGVFLGDRVVSRGRIPFVSPEALAKAHEYYALHGGMTVVAARFVPILRLVVPLVGGWPGCLFPASWPSTPWARPSGPRSTSSGAISSVGFRGWRKTSPWSSWWPWACRFWPPGCAWPTSSGARQSARHEEGWPNPPAIPVNLPPPGGIGYIPTASGSSAVSATIRHGMPVPPASKHMV